MTISLTGLSSASADETVCITRYAAEECLRKSERFDELADEARKIRTQRDECAGRVVELRDGQAECWEDMRSLEGEVAALESRTPRRWFFAGGVVVGVLVVGVPVVW